MPAKKNRTLKPEEMYRVAGRIDPQIGLKFDEVVGRSGMKKYKAIEKAFKLLVDAYEVSAPDLTQSGQLTNKLS